MSKKPLNVAAEEMQAYGSRYLSYSQLFECIGIPPSAAATLLTMADNVLGNIAKMTTTDIASIKGIGAGKATAILAAIEIGKRRQLEQAHSKEQIMSSLDMYDHLSPRMRDSTQEEFWIALLDRRSKIIRIEQIHVGGQAAMVVDAKVIFRKALQYRACSVVMGHNHPSGAPSPSMEDIRLTEKIKQAGSFLDIKVLDHIIIGDGSYYSFADEGKL